MFIIEKSNAIIFSPLSFIIILIFEQNILIIYLFYIIFTSFTGPLLRVLVSVFAPVYWTTVYQTQETQNGFSITEGQFRQESQLEFETGYSSNALIRHVAVNEDETITLWILNVCCVLK